MSYCPECGAVRAEAESEPDVIVEAEHTEKPDVEIARIQADRDIKLAKITAGVAETDQVAELAHAEGVAEGMAEAIAPEVSDQAPETPVIVVDDNPEPEAPEIAPEPPTAESAPSEAKHERSGYGSNAWFG
jgi:hypothetical protein